MEWKVRRSQRPRAKGQKKPTRGGGAPDHLPTTEEYAKAVFYKPGRRCRRKNDTPPQGREALAQNAVLYSTFRKEHCCE